MKSSLIQLIVLLILNCTSFASHIVGGEFELVYTGRDYLYQIHMNMYYDDINAASGLFEADKDITVGIFQKSNNVLVKTAIISRISSDYITYSYNGCSDPSIVRNRTFKYIGNVDLYGFTASGGYYISWERCCRNYVSKNIIHDMGGIKIEGQVFYLEFPPVIINSQRFLNSSPVFSPVPADYLCKGIKYEVSYAGSDIDGDSLVYSLVSPLKGHTDDYSPILDSPLSAPYDTVIWAFGYGRLNMIPGNPALRVNKNTGMISVTPNTSGLFVFAIRVEEYRNGVKIGESRRDFQYLVYDCPPNYGTSVTLDKTSNPVFVGDSLIVPINQLTCFDVLATDSNTTQFGENETILIHSESTSSVINSTFYFSQTSANLSASNDTAKSAMCFDPCNKLEPLQDTLVRFFIVVSDVKCPAKFDTIDFWVKYVLPAGNDIPEILTSLPVDTVDLLVDSLLQFDVYGLDPDPSDLYPITVAGSGFSLDYYGMNFKNTFLGVDSASARFSWRPDCDDLKLSTRYLLTFSVKDKSCLSSHQVSRKVLLRLKDNESTLASVKPPNLITPNGDQKNDCFRIPNMPGDNCDVFFKRVDVYNRWGSVVYTSDNRNFEWCPGDNTDGIYYYYLDLNEAQIKGWVQVIR